MIIWRVEYQNGCSPYPPLVPARNKSREEREVSQRANEPALDQPIRRRVGARPLVASSPTRLVPSKNRTRAERPSVASDLLQQVEEAAVSHNDLLERGTTPANDSRPINQAAGATPHTQNANPLCVFTCSSFHVLLGLLRVVDWVH
ncbi:unnamed protein product [Brassica rapa]|uniref:Uncharacterized protein n=1 Tax=Brassica campestris TaxID=3711 RepID=A0A3P5YJ11_BRACM|nr:unnamed protein product [Brassica rapa]VDC61390.1 unnamed protein product [Brassica rapa]